MGATFSSGNSVYVQTDRPDYVSGQDVKGNAYVNIVSPISCNGIFLTLEGTERTHWSERKSRQIPDGTNEDGSTRYQTEYYTEEHRGDHVIIRQRSMLYNLGGQALNPGQYTFPFTFRLPTGIPGSFIQGNWADGIMMKGWNSGGWGEDSKEEFVRGIVSYTLEVEADAKEWFGDVKHRQPLTIYPALQTEIKAVKESKTANVMVCCCIDKGSATMTVYFDKNCYVPGEMCRIICEAKNDSEVDFEAIKVKVKRQLTLRGTGGHQYNNVTELVREKFEGVKAKTDATGAAARNVPVTLVDQKGLGAFVPETRGHLIECKYWAEVEFDIPYAPDIEIRLPLTIYAPQPPPDWAIAAPPGYWNPDPSNVYGPQAISFG